MYAVRFTTTAARILKKLPTDVQRAITDKAQTLTEQPLAGEPLKGRHRQFRSLHLTHNGVAYRIIYQVFEKAETAMVYLADKRENIYKRLEHMGI
jgi:mRNA-degrading endonuclease RelE of RelBE toxin-antitoxin system